MTTQGMNVHVSPDGTVVATAVMHDGRVLRVCGAREYRGCVVTYELWKWMKWEASRGR